MAFKKRVARKISANVRIVTTKTAYGIDSDMLVTDENVLEKLTAPADHVFVEDDNGIFSVPSSDVDSGLVCHLRTTESHRAKWDRVCIEQEIKEEDKA